MIGSLLILIFVVFAVLYFFFSRNFNHWKKKKVPYLKPVPFFGNSFKLFTFQENIGEGLQRMHYNSNHPYLGFFICDQPCLLIRDLELIKTICIKDFNIFDNRNITQNFEADPISANNLFILKNPLWRELRRRLSATYTTAKMRAMFPLFLEAVGDLVQFLEKQDGKSVDVKETIGKFTTDAIYSIAFGVNSESFKNPNSEYRYIARQIFNLDNFGRAVSSFAYFLAPRLVHLFGLKFIDQKCSDFLSDLFRQTMEERIEKKFVRNDLLDIIIELKQNDKSLDNYQLIGQAVTFFIGGFETTTSTTTFGLFHLSQHPEIQNKIRKEIFESGSLTYDSIHKMKYLDMCVKEILRMYPIVPFLDRRNNIEYNIPNTDVVLDKETPVFISNLALHYSEQYWSNPQKFDPERFSSENIENITPFSYLPFGDGPRNCIGMRYGLLTVKIALIGMLSKFEVHLADTTQKSIPFAKKAFLLLPEHHLFMKFKKLAN